jgi:hypothetical protein
MRSGDPWGTPATGAADAEGAGDDAALAALAREHRGELVRFVPDDRCDFARAIGLTVRSTGASEVAVDLLRVDDVLGVNVLTIGTPPNRLRRWTRSPRFAVTVDGRAMHTGPATSVVVANGQYLDGLDLVPRGHPGDGRLEVQVYALAAGERHAMRARLRSGTHLPHPRIHTASGRRVEIRAEPPTEGALDGVPTTERGDWIVDVVPSAVRLLV